MDLDNCVYNYLFPLLFSYEFYLNLIGSFIAIQRKYNPIIASCNHNTTISTVCLIGILKGEVEQISMMKPKALTEHEDGMLEYLEDIIGSSKYKEPIEELSKEVESLNEARGEKVIYFLF